MSPEYDGKLFGVMKLSDYIDPMTRQYYHIWNSIEGTRWIGKPMFPISLTPEERTVAFKEFQSIP